ncbi:MAG: 3-oxoadipate enol-lactonase [Rhodobacteraceae bacterium]|nr:3-oxoadipate enol-lactonase [Paracoccaceae bacterium]
MQICDIGDINLHYREDGDPNGAPIVFANSLGTDLRLWDQVVPLLPAGLRIIRYDKRGHGLSDATPAPYGMGTLVRDAERLLDALGVKNCVFVGLSIGGLIAQGLVVKRPDLISGLVLSNTAAKIGTADMYAARVAAVKAGGIEPLAEGILERWFTPAFRATPEFSAWRNMLIRQPVEGYAGCCAAISGTDFYTTTAALTLPTMAIVGSEDGATPPDLVRETADLIKRSQFEIIRGAGHLPCVEKPAEYAELLTKFLLEIGHV